MEEIIGISAVVLAILGPVLGCMAYTEKIELEAITEMVQRGADPVAAMCAVNPGENAAICGAYAARK